jgi:hypothetical protein
MRLGGASPNPDIAERRSVVAKATIARFLIIQAFSMSRAFLTQSTDNLFTGLTF